LAFPKQFDRSVCAGTIRYLFTLGSCECLGCFASPAAQEVVETIASTTGNENETGPVAAEAGSGQAVIAFGLAASSDRHAERE